MEIINPNFALRENNSFSIRRIDYNSILEKAEKILIPATELGFEITQLRIKDHKFTSGELFSTLKKNLVIRLQKEEAELDLSMFIPKIIDNNYIFINGRKKIPLFQLYDTPIVTRGKSIKLLTNVCSLYLSITKGENEPYIKVTYMGKQIPFSTLMFCYFGMEELNNRYGLDQIDPLSDDIVNPTSDFDKLISDLVLCYSESEGYEPEDFIAELGKMYTKYNFRLKGADLVYAIDLILQTDILSAKFFNEANVLDELIQVMKTGNIDDTDFRNKRIRMFEYMILGKLSKYVFDLCYTNRTAKKPKFNVHSSQILSECNVSDIVQFDFAINPIDELTKLTRTSLVGPGGFKRENVPSHLRDITPSMFGRICPVDTPDRDNCGILQNLIPNALLDENMRFREEVLEKQPISIPVSMVPFLEHDDQTRLQMSSSQMRQAIMLKNFETPLVRSGCENLYTNETQFIKRAKKDGEVLYINNDFIIVAYDDNVIDVFSISYRKIYVQNMDFMSVYVSVGDKVKAGDILAESNFCKDGNIVFGRNLSTAIMPYHGYNYEDGIVISNRLKDDIFASIQLKDLSFNIPPNKVLLSLEKGIYKPLLEPEDSINAGENYAIIKEIASGLDSYSVFNEEKILKAKNRMLIVDVNIYANNWNDLIQEYKDWVNQKIESQLEKQNYLKNTLNEFLTKENTEELIRDKNLDKFSHTGKYKIKGEQINGILVEMNAIFFRPIKIGDKIANRHGNKGVIAKIVDHDQMPQLEDGSHVDICINPLGIISRMNIGQLYELHLGLSIKDLKINLSNMLEEGKPQLEVKNYLLDYITIIDNTENDWYLNQFKDQLPSVIDKEFIDELTVIQPPFESVSLDKIKEALEYTNTKFEQTVYDPTLKCYIENPIATGYMYFFRMVHIAEDRLAGRSIGPYTQRTLQPLSGRKNKGGQRVGEMEMACIIAHDAPENLHEFLTTKSDCIDLKNKCIKDMIDSDVVTKEGDEDFIPESVKLLNSYLTVIGINQLNRTRRM